MDVYNARSAFALWLQQLHRQAVGQPHGETRPRYSDTKKMLEAMDERMQARKLPTNERAPTQNGFDYWLNGKHLPRDHYVEPLVDVLIGSTADNDPQRTKTWELWNAAYKEKQATYRFRRGRPLQEQPIGVQPLDDSDDSNSDWQSYNGRPLQRGLSDLFLHPPPRGGNMANIFPLRISLSFAECPDTIEGCDITVALRRGEVFLEAYYDHCRPSAGSRVGEEAANDGLLEFRAGNWRVRGPHTPNNHLDGEPLGDKPLCTVVADGTSSDSIALAIRSRHRALIVVPDEPEHDPEPLKAKLLQLLLQKSLKDRNGLITWNKGILKRKSTS